MTEPKPVPREVQARIVEDLARGHRSIASIAARHHVPADLVFKLRDLHGPGLADLSEAARKLRRPGGHPADTTEPDAGPVPAPVEALSWKRYHDGLTSEERRTCRAWAGLPVNSRQAPKDARDRWVAAGRPQAEEPNNIPAPDHAAAIQGPAPMVEPVAPGVVDIVWPDPAAEPPLDTSSQRYEAAAAVLDAVPDVDAAAVAVLDDGLTVDDEDDVIDAPIVCAACEEPLPDPTADGCPSCDAQFERIQADKHAEWSEFYAECLTVPELATECVAVAAAVYRLRDAHAEHLHREQLVQRVQDAIKPHLHLTLNQVRLVLDAIEAA